MRTCYTAIIGNYEDLKEPSVKSPGWQFVCFTDQPLKSNTWKIINIDSTGVDSQRLARRIKILGHAFIETPEYLWLDASFQINIDLNTFWNKYFKSPLTTPKHPVRDCVYAEGRSCLVNNRGNASTIIKQMEAYKNEGVEGFKNNIISSGILMRDRGSVALCKTWWDELEKWSTRDQIAFAKVCKDFDWYMFKFDYSQSREIKYVKHYHLRH